MSDELTVRRQARESIQSGKLPNRKPQNLWGGPAAGERCTICGEQFRQGEMGFELEFGPGEGSLAARNHILHVHCFAAWEVERQQSIDESRR